MLPAHIAPRDWVGETAVIVASGPSTDTVDLSPIWRHRVIAVAHGYRAVPHAEVLIVGGVAFYRQNDLSQFRGSLIVASGPGVHRLRPWDPRMVMMLRDRPLGVSGDPGALSGSESSVMLAINYAVHRGVSRIVLLGCDGQPSPAGMRRVGQVERDTRNARDRYRAQEEAMRTQLLPLAMLGVEIVNCSPGSALTIYRRDRLDAVLR